MILKCTHLGDVDAFDALDNIIPTDRRTRGKRVDYTEVVDLGDDNGFEAGEEVSKENKGAPAGPRTRAPQRKPAVDIDEGEGDGDGDGDGEEEEEYGDSEDENDDGTDSDEYEEDEEE